MSDERMEVKNAIRVSDPICPTCGSNLPYQVSVDAIEAHDTAWVLRGTGKPKSVKVQCSCPNCGQMFTTLMSMIPIECAPFPCPKCGHLQDLEYKVQHIQAEKDSFQFEAKIICKKCGNTKSFKEVLKKILEV